MKTYPSNLTKRERNFIKPHLFKRGNKHRRKWKWKTILNAMFYVLRTGCQWRALLVCFPPCLDPKTHLLAHKTAPDGRDRWQTIYDYHRRFCELGIWETLNTKLRIILRLRDKRNAQPSAVVFDTQSVKALHGGGERGFDGYKRVNGRKRFLLVDTMGLLLSVKIVAANTAETKAAMIGLEGTNKVYDKVEIAWADQGFGGEPFRSWMKETLVGHSVC